MTAPIVRTTLAMLLLGALTLGARAYTPTTAPAPLPVIDAPAMDAEDVLTQAEHWMDRGLELAEDDPRGSVAAFTQAATLYESLASEHHARNAPLFRALGIARLHAGDLGGSIAALRAAEELDPTDRRTRESLRAARARVEAAPEFTDPTDADRWLSIWRGYVPRSGMLAIGLALLALGWTLTGAHTLGRRPGRAWIGAAFLGALVPLGLLAHDYRRTARTVQVVLIQEAVGRGGPSHDIYDPTHEDPLPEGLEAVALESRDGWTELRLAGSERAWVPSESLVTVGSLLGTDAGVPSPQDGPLD
ncbi:MAG: hypothetical protein ACF8Q5_06100 [Phycisphaerales bacterium JB040]